jgi:hypothetical protein
MQAITKMFCPVPESISRSTVEISVQGNEVLAVIKKASMINLMILKRSCLLWTLFPACGFPPLTLIKMSISVYTWTSSQPHRSCGLKTMVLLHPIVSRIKFLTENFLDLQNQLQLPSNRYYIKLYLVVVLH